MRLDFPVRTLLAAIVTLHTVPIFAQAAWCGAKIKVLHNFGETNDGTEPNGTLVLTGRQPVRRNVRWTRFVWQRRSVRTHARDERRWAETIVHSFTGGSGGAIPWGAPIGTQRGTWTSPFNIRERRHRWNIQLYSGSRGLDLHILYTGVAGPGLLINEVGNLYGSIGLGDYFGVGAIGELSPGSDGWSYTQLYSFCGQNGCPDGYDLLAPPIWDGKGNMWGTMFTGGMAGQPVRMTLSAGAIFAMTPNWDGTWTYHVVIASLPPPPTASSPQAAGDRPLRELLRHHRRRRSI